MIILSTHVTMTPNRGMKNFYNTKVDGVKVFKYSDETAEAVASGEKLLKESQTVYESFADMMSPEDAKRYLDFLENGSREGLTSAELAGVEKADALLVSQKVGYEDVWDLRNAGDVLESGRKGGTYTNLDDGLNFSNKALEHMGESGCQVPVQTLQDAIRYGEAMPDPSGSSATMYYTTMYKNGKMYNLEVLYDEVTNMVYHFEYARKAMGNLPAIPK